MTRTTQVASPPHKPLMVFDGDCNFCRRWIARWQQCNGDRVEYLPFQDASIAARFPEIPREQFEQAVQLIETDGRVSSAAEAVVRSLTYAPRKGWMRWAYENVPGAASVSEWAYRLVANNRSAFSFLTRLLWGEHVQRPTYHLVRWLFLRLLGVIYLIAFVSLWTQIDGLVGSKGILPAEEMMQSAREQVAQQEIGLARYRYLPTLCWISASDRFLHGLCGGGALLAVLLIAGVAPAIVLFLLWLFYLSLTCVCGVFLGYQWDALLLETGFLSVFFAPLQWLPRLSRDAPPSSTVLWLLRLLLFKLMFFSGAVKLVSRDSTWHNLSALNYHYETQPLPTWVGWYAHQLPDWFQEMSVFVMFGMELLAPFLIFTPRRPRFAGCVVLLVLQALIALTGNYCFFNLLTVALCVLLLDDAWIRVAADVRRRLRWLELPARNKPSPPPHVGGYERARRWPVWIVAPLAVVILAITLMLTGRLFGANLQQWPTPFVALSNWLAPFHSINSYGLFAVMTTSRPEIVIEGSGDGKNWQPYEFKYKPGDPARRPRFVAPHQPRLDWQMWFEALRVLGPRPQPSPWFYNFCECLLRGSPEAVTLLKHNPFPEAPPHYLRALVYDYHFTDFATRRATGHWWRRELKGLYCPELSLKQESRDNP